MPQPEFLRKILSNGEIETAIREAMRRHEVVLHMYEESDMNRAVPDGTWNSLVMNRKLFKAPHPSIDDPAQVAIISASLPPSPDSGHSLEPYGLRVEEPSVGFMLSIAREGATPARILRAFRDKRVTGYTSTAKDLFLDEFPSMYGVTKQSYIQMALGNPRVHETELRTITQGQFIDYPQFAARVAGRELPAEGIAFPWNEVMGIFSDQHLMSITIPKTADMDRHYRGFFNEQTKLAGALSCLANMRHPKHPVSLPLVQYHVNQPRMGDIKVLAYGEDQMIDLAHQCVIKMKKSPHFYMRPDMHRVSTHVDHNLREILGIDISLPLDQLGFNRPAGVRSPG